MLFTLYAISYHETLLLLPRKPAFIYLSVSLLAELNKVRGFLLKFSGRLDLVKLTKIAAPNALQLEINLNATRRHA